MRSSGLCLCFSLCCMLNGPVDVAFPEATHAATKWLRSSVGARKYFYEEKNAAVGGNCAVFPTTERIAAGKLMPLLGTAHSSQIHGVLRLRGGVRKQGRSFFEFTGAGGEKVSVGGDGEVQGGQKVRT
jgi:hypothetical protein